MITISPNDVEELCLDLAKQIPLNIYSGLFPVLNGGAVPAAILSKFTGLPILNELSVNCLVVDDVVDSGVTRKKFEDYPFAALHIKKDTPVQFLPTYYAQKMTGWIKYWWEEKEESPIHENIIRVLEYIGENPNREGIVETPSRVVRSWEELFAGYKQDPHDVIKTFESGGYDQIVLLRDIELYSMCEHHMLPFVGRAHVAYIPGGRVIGISKLARLVDIFSRRLQIQERIGEQVTKILMEELNAQGAACIIEADHFCIRMRGVGKQHSTMVTSSMKGVFLTKPEARAELMGLIRS
jgi:GTP cyclohydrolase I